MTAEALDLPFGPREIGEALANFATGIQVQGSDPDTGYISELVETGVIEVLGYLVADVNGGLPIAHRCDAVQRAMQNVALSALCMGIIAQRRRQA